MKAILLCLTLAACRLYAQDTTMYRHLPPDAVGIYQFNLPVLTTKLSWQDLTNPIPEPQPNTYNRELALILRDPEHAGVDIHRPIYMVESERPPGMSLLVALTDSARWAIFLKKAEPGIRITAEPAGPGAGALHPAATTALAPATPHPAATASPAIAKASPSYAARRDRMGAAWNEQLAVITFTPPNFSASALRRSQTLLNGYDDKTGLIDSLFLSGFADDADIHAWTRPGRTLSLLLQQFLPISLPSLGTPAIQMHTLCTLRFEKGRVLIKTLMPLPPTLIAAYTQLISKPMSTELLRHVPSDKPIGTLNIRFDPQALPLLLDSLQSRGRVEAKLFDKGVSLETLVNAFEGNLLATFLQPDSSKPAFFLAAALRDPGSFQTWVGRLKWLPNRHVRAFSIQDHLAVVGPGAHQLKSWFAVPASPAADTRADDRCPVSAWLDIKPLASLLPLLSPFTRLTFTAGTLNASSQVESTLELQTANPTENSLKTIFQIFK